MSKRNGRKGQVIQPARPWIAGKMWLFSTLLELLLALGVMFRVCPGQLVLDPKPNTYQETTKPPAQSGAIIIYDG